MAEQPAFNRLTEDRYLVLPPLCARSLTERHLASNEADVGSNPAGRTIFLTKE